MSTLAAFLERAARVLQAAGIESPRREARALASALLGGGLPARQDRVLAPDQALRLERALARRAAREPLGRILGSRGFWSLELALNPATLEPRPDSETLVEAVLAALGDSGQAWRLLDLGTGSGCLLLALLAELPRAWGVGVDLAPQAAAQAAANAVANGLAGRAAFLAGDWAAALEGSFDAVIGNPPYIAAGEIAGLDPEVRLYDPPLALDGGADGLAAYRALLPQARRLLRPGGLLALEHGAGQAAAVALLAGAEGFAAPRSLPDLAGRPRVLLARRPPLPADSEKSLGIRGAAR